MCTLTIHQIAVYVPEVTRSETEPDGEWALDDTSGPHKHFSKLILMVLRIGWMCK